MSKHFFETSKELRSYSPGSTSTHFRVRNGIVTPGKDGIGIDVCFGLAFAASLPALYPISLLRFSCVSSDVSVTYLFYPFMIITHE